MKNMRRYIVEDALKIGNDKDELQNSWKAHYLGVLDTIKKTGSYTPPRPLNRLRRLLFCQNHTLDYIIYANLKENSYYINPETYKEVCAAYITAFDECASIPKTAILIRKYLIELLTMYVQSCESIKDLEPQRSIVHGI